MVGSIDGIMQWCNNSMNWIYACKEICFRDSSELSIDILLIANPSQTWRDIANTVAIMIVVTVKECSISHSSYPHHNYGMALLIRPQL